MKKTGFSTYPAIPLYTRCQGSLCEEAQTAETHSDKRVREGNGIGLAARDRIERDQRKQNDENETGDKDAQNSG